MPHQRPRPRPAGPDEKEPAKMTSATPAAPAAAPDLLIRDEEGVRWIVLNRPGSANAAEPVLMRALCEAIDAAVADPAADAIVLAGEGRHFLAGGDLDWLSRVVGGEDADAAGEIYRWFQGATRRLIACPKPVVAAISGAAVTVGCEIALACDVRLVDPSAFFQQSWLDLGLIAPLGGAKLLPQIVGLGMAKEMLLECRKVGAEEAVAIGLASEMLPGREELRARAQARARAMAARPARPFAILKDLVHTGLSESLEDIWVAGVEAQGALIRGEDFRKAVRARRP